LPDDSPKLDYRAAGVDLDAADRAKKAIKSLVASTHDRHTLSGIGSFGGMYAVPAGLEEPVLVSSADGVGTKLKVAFLSGRHDTVGADLVNHCVNDILVQGARPLFFMDYLATGDMDAGVVGQVVAERALKAGITTVAFDRSGFKFHGRIKALADAAREQGIKF